MRERERVCVCVYVCYLRIEALHVSHLIHRWVPSPPHLHRLLLLKLLLNAVLLLLHVLLLLVSLLRRLLLLHKLLLGVWGILLLLLVAPHPPLLHLRLGGRISCGSSSRRHERLCASPFVCVCVYVRE